MYQNYTVYSHCYRIPAEQEKQSVLLKLSLNLGNISGKQILKKHFFFFFFFFLDVALNLSHNCTVQREITSLA